LTEYDRKQSRKRFYNRYALGQYFQALECAEAAVAGGATYRQALCTNFNGRLLDVCLRSIGEPVATLAEAR
jgi:hypothetical protein